MEKGYEIARDEKALGKTGPETTTTMSHRPQLLNSLPKQVRRSKLSQVLNTRAFNSLCECPSLGRKGTPHEKAPSHNQESGFPVLSLPSIIASWLFASFLKHLLCTDHRRQNSCLWLIHNFPIELPKGCISFGDQEAS